MNMNNIKKNLPLIFLILGGLLILGGILMLIFGALTMFVTGVFYAWSILKTPFKFEK